MKAVLHSATIAVFAHPGDLVVGRQRHRHGLGELGAEDRLGAVGDEGAITLVAAARLLDGRVAFGHHRLQQQHRQHAQREESLQLVGAVEGPEAARGGERGHGHGDAGGERRAPRAAEHRDPHQHRVDDVRHVERRIVRAVVRAGTPAPSNSSSTRERRVGSGAAAARAGDSAKPWKPMVSSSGVMTSAPRKSPIHQLCTAQPEILVCRARSRRAALTATSAQASVDTSAADRETPARDAGARRKSGRARRHA